VHDPLKQWIPRLHSMKPKRSFSMPESGLREKQHRNEYKDTKEQHDLVQH
jgi:hypothetical protein